MKARSIWRTVSSDLEKFTSNNGSSFTRTAINCRICIKTHVPLTLLHQ
jgi:hypothetical protein